MDAIIVNKQDACGLTPAVSKVSAGALEFLPLYSVKYVGKFLEGLKESGDFRIVSTNVDDDSEELKIDKEEGQKLPLTPIANLKIQDQESVLLILGAEGHGVSRTISSLATDKVIIPPLLDDAMIGQDPFDKIDSLNVGVSAAVLMYHIK